MIQSVKLGKLCKMQSGGTPSRSNLEYYEGDFPWAKISDLEKSDDGYIYKTEEHITQEALKSINNRQFKPGTLLLAMYGSVGKTAITKIDLTTNQAILGINILDKTILDIKYLKYWFSTIKQRLLNRAVGAALPNISLGIVKELEIPLPPLPQQEKIANILDAADALRQNDKALLAKYDELIQTLFLDMFGDPVSNPKGWSLVSAEKHIDLLTGYAFKSELYSKNPKHMRLCGGLIIMPWGIEWDKSNKWDYSNSGILDKYQLKVDDIVMAMDRPWIGSGFKIAKIKNEDIPSLLVQRTARIRSKDFNPIFLFHFYNSSGFERHAKPTETTIPHISPKDIKTYLIFNTPIELQNQFAERVTLIEEQKAIAQKSLEKSEELFHSLLQKAFKGELI